MSHGSTGGCFKRLRMESSGAGSAGILSFRSSWKDYLPVPQRNEQPERPRRAPEAMALFNEIFTSELLVNACWAKEQDSGAGLTWPAAFLVLPLALHPPTRETLPRSPRVTLAAWAVR